MVILPTLLAALALFGAAGAVRIHPNGNTAYCLTQEGNLSSDNINDSYVSVKRCNGSARQNWEARTSGPTHFKMKGQCIRPLTGASCSWTQLTSGYDGTSWVFAGCSERTLMQPLPGGKYRQRDPMYSQWKCLDLQHGDVARGSVNAWRCAANQNWGNQRWTFS